MIWSAWSKWPGMFVVWCLPAFLGCASPETPTTRLAEAKTTAVADRQGRLEPPNELDDFDITTVPGRIHFVQPNETLWSISQRYYGHGKHWRKILVANRNRLTDSTELPVGMKLIIP